MSYLSGFKYDVFMSYAHVDNATLTDQEKGWITRFYECLKLMLAQNIGVLNSAQIWWDERLRKNQLFNEEIKDAIRTSAFFITFGSNGYYSSTYCMNELKWFYDHCTKSSLGSSVQNNSRVYNILLNKKAHESWPTECSGVNAYEMFELLHPDRDMLGYPIDPDTKVFQKKIKELANDIYHTMQLLQERSTDTPQETPAGEIKSDTLKPKIFIARVTDTMLKEKNQLIKELEANHIEVIKRNLPPPYNKEQHEEEVKKILRDVDLSIHLFDDVPGDEIENETATFSQAQAIIARQMSKNQLIFIPKDLDLEGIEDAHHKNFLQELQNSKKENDNYTLIRESALPNILHEIKVKIDESTKLQQAAGNGHLGHAAFLDFHEQDNIYAIEMANLLSMNNIQTFFSPYASDPKEILGNYDMQLKKAKSLILICGKNVQERVKERLNTAIQTIMREDCPVLACAVYLAPQVQNKGPLIPRSFLQIEYLDDSKSPRFNPDTVEPFIRKIA